MLIKEYREQHKILLNIEHRLMLQMAPDYDHLTLMQKVEVFEYALDNTPGQDLYRVLWLKSRNSESWLERRLAYTPIAGRLFPSPVTSWVLAIDTLRICYSTGSPAKSYTSTSATASKSPVTDPSSRKKYRSDSPACSSTPWR